jgi:hypothetical protein
MRAAQEQQCGISIGTVNLCEWRRVGTAIAGATASHVQRFMQVQYA